MSWNFTNPLLILCNATLLLFPSVQDLKTDPQSQEPPAAHGDPVLGERIAGGVVSERRLWLRGIGDFRAGSGGLISLSLADETRQVHFERGVLDMEKSGHDLWVLRRSSPDARKFVVSVWKKDSFEDMASFTASEKDEPISLLSGAAGLIVLSARAIRILSPGERAFKLVKLKGKFRGGFQETAGAPLGGDSVYVGFNTGEWGGGLQSVNLRTGAVADVERRDTKELCAGPLNSDCDPVTGVIADPQNKECVLASIGLVHMFSHGRILRVCGKNVSVVFEKTETVDIFNGKKLEMTDAFFGLAPAAEAGFWGISSEALYRFGGDGTKQEEFPLPKLESVSGIFLSRKLPGVIVVRTDANWAVSVSGYTPLLVPLEDPGPELHNPH